MSRKRIPFGVMLQGPGGHMNAWKHPSVPADASINFEHYVRAARQAEKAGIAFVFIAEQDVEIVLPLKQKQAPVHAFWRIALL